MNRLFAQKSSRRKLLIVSAAAWAALVCGCGFFHQGGWHKVAPMPEPRWFGGAGVGSHGKIYAFGGYVMPKGKPVQAYGIGKYSLVIYDPKTNRWSRGPAAPPLRVEDRFWGSSSDEQGRPTRIAEVAEDKIPLPYEVPNGGADRQGRIYWFARWGFVEFNPASGKWEESLRPIRYEDEQRWERIPTYYRTASATAVGPRGRLFLIGGIGELLDPRAPSSGLKLLKSVDVLDPATMHWSQAAPMHQGRELFAAAFGPDGKLYVFGGYGGTGEEAMRPNEPFKEYKKRLQKGEQLAHHALDSVERYDPKTDTWSSRAPMPLGVEGAAAALGADGRIYVVGGAPSYADPKPVRRVQVYDPRTDTWSEGPPLRTARQGHMVVATPDGRIWAIGGTNEHSVLSLRMLIGEAGIRGSPLASVEVLDTRPKKAR